MTISQFYWPIGSVAGRSSIGMPTSYNVNDFSTCSDWRGRSPKPTRVWARTTSSWATGRMGTTRTRSVGSDEYEYLGKSHDAEHIRHKHCPNEDNYTKGEYRIAGLMRHSRHYSAGFLN